MEQKLDKKTHTHTQDSKIQANGNEILESNLEQNKDRIRNTKIQGPFNKHRDWFAVSSTERLMGVRLVGSVEGSPTTQAHFSSVASGHALRQEVDFCDM